MGAGPVYTRAVIVPLSALHALGHALFAASGARTRRLQSGRRRLTLYDKRGTGSGPPLLLVHGLGSNAHSFSALLRPLAKLSRRLVLPDLPGHGRSAFEKGAPPLAVDELGEAVLAVLDDLGEPAVVVGNSLGGALGLHALIERPAQVLGFVGLAPAGAPLTSAERDSLRHVFGGGLPAARELQRRLFHQTPKIAWLILRDFGRYWQRPEVQPMVAEILSAEVRLAFHRLREHGRPALVLWGESDNLLPRSSVEFFKQELGASAVEVLERCGHLPQLERPRLVARRLAQFLAALPV